LVTERSLTRSPHFQVSVTQQTAQLKAADWSGLTVRALDVSAAQAQQDLSIELHETATAVVVSFEYRRALFAASFVRRMVQSFQRLLAAAVAQPTLTLQTVPRLDARERAALAAWNDRRHTFPLHQSYAALVEAQVRAAPGHVVATCGDDAITYEVLWRRSGAVATALLASGATPGSLVVIAAERGLPLLSLLLGVLRARCAFLTLEVAQPSARLVEIVGLSGAQHVLVSEQARTVWQRVAAQLGTRELVVHDGAALLASASPDDRGPALLAGDPRDLAYVMFTSGSTGVPKGVMVEQRGMLNNIFGKLPALGLGPRDHIAQTASCAFDISVWQLLAAPLLGAHVTILPDAITHDPAQLLAALGRCEISVAEVVPAVLKTLLELATDDHALPALRWLIVTGEAAVSGPCLAWLTRFPHVRLMNAYGPAECSDDVAMHELTAYELRRGLTPIGQPTANNRLYVVDEHLQPVPRGVAGELVIGGVGVGRGYLGDPERTARSFVRAPWLDPDGRVYRSGDVCRLNESGALEFVGRSDDQVKIRGHRIELGEIEGRLRKLTGGDSAVVAVHDARGELQLVAYCEQAPGDVLDALRAELPGYMVPGWLVALSPLPHSDNGKLDRRALRSRGLPEPSAPVASAAPIDAGERAIAQLYAQVLSLPPERVGRHAGFFELGGHSLLATLLITRLRERLLLPVTLRDLFTHPSVAQLAHRARSLQLEAAVDERPSPRPERLPLSAAQARLWFLSQLSPHTAEYNIATALELTGPLDVAAFEAALGVLVARHEILRSVIGQDADGPYLVVAAAPQPRLAVQPVVADDERRWHSECRRLAQAEAARVFDLAQGPLFRVALHRWDNGVGEARWLLLLTFHHIVSDDWSTQVLIDELSEVYRAQQAARPACLAPLPWQYVDWSVWLQEPAQQARAAQQLDYWRAQLDDGDYELQLPIDPRLATQHRWDEAGVVRSQLAPALTDQLRRTAAALGVTPFSVLIAGLQWLLSRYADQRDVRIGMPVANREQVQTQGLIGCFVNTIVLRSNVAPEASFATLARQVRDGLVAAQEHQDVPFAHVVDALVPERSLTRTPLFQVLVSTEAARLDEAAWPNLRLRELALPPPAAQFDLGVELHDDGRGIAVLFKFRRARLDEALVARMLESYQRILGPCVEQPEAPLAHSAQLGPGEQAQLVQWHAT
ncbi:MAG: amino acid adenylation domain-containing protein, partial [Polyangiales bacterium]